MKTRVLTLLSQTINAYLHLDPESKTKFAKLSGKAFAIELLPFHFMFYCLFDDKGIVITTNENLTPETIIRGTPLQLASVALTKQNRQRFFAEDVMMEGNAELGQKVIELFDELTIDWEEYLSHFVGDIPAYHVGRTVTGIKNWLQNINDSFTQNVNEYVHEEAQYFPAPEAVQEFYNDVDQLRMDVDRAEARINQLRTMLANDEVAS